MKRILYKNKTKYKTGDWRELPKKQINNKPRVAWVLAGNEQVGSSRLKGILIDRFSHINSCEFLSTIAYTQRKQDARLWWHRHEWRPFLKRIDVLVTQTWAGSTLALLENCQKLGIVKIFSLSDLHIEKIPKMLFDYFDAVVVSSDYLRKEVSRFHENVLLFDDPIEVPAGFIRQYTNNGRNPELVWMGHWEHWSEVEFIKEILNNSDFNSLGLCTVTKHLKATHQWNLETCWDDISHSDIAVIPCRTDEWGISKSNNRLTAFMSLGYPVIASPIPSYKKYINHGVNGFFAENKSDWINYLSLLRDPNLRIQIGIAARETPELKSIRIEHVVEKWSDLFQVLLKQHK